MDIAIAFLTVALLALVVRFVGAPIRARAGHEPRPAAYHVGRQMLDEEGAQARRLRWRQEQEPERRQHLALLQLQRALQILRPVRREAAGRQPLGRLVVVAAAECNC